MFEAAAGNGGPRQTGILQEEQCLPRAGKELNSLNEEILAEGRRERPQVLLGTKCSRLRAVCHTAEGKVLCPQWVSQLSGTHKELLITGPGNGH